MSRESNGSDFDNIIHYNFGGEHNSPEDQSRLDRLFIRIGRLAIRAKDALGLSDDDELDQRGLESNDELRRRGKRATAVFAGVAALTAAVLPFANVKDAPQVEECAYSTSSDAYERPTEEKFCVLP